MDLRRLLDAQRSAQLAEGPPSTEERGARVDRLIFLLTETAARLTDALDADFGNRPRAASLLSDVAGIIPDLLHTRKHLGRWSKSERVGGTAMMGLPTIVEKRPLGVVGIIGPWNFPVGLVVQPAASALAAGNRVMIKFSEVTPRTAEVFATAARRYFAPEELVVVTGGPDVGAEFSGLPFDHLFFTGSPGVGALVARTAGANLVPVTLELGGKNPAVVGPAADVATSAKRIMSARLANGGQLCLCPDYAFVPTRSVDAFVDAALDVGRAATSNGNADGLVSIVNDRNFDRVTALVEDARAKGAAVRSAPIGNDRARRRIAPTVLTGVNDDMQVAHDEVFGPVLCVLPYDHVSEVITYVNGRPAPLAAYWFGPKDDSFDVFVSHVNSGGMTVNDFAAHCAITAAPFGGVGQSGSGAYHGKTGFNTFSHHRTITTSQLPIGLGSMLIPPYSSLMTGAIGRYVALQGWAAKRRLARAGHRTQNGMDS
jgi:coniferyl-aldehyde dehydrogenase